VRRFFFSFFLREEARETLEENFYSKKKISEEQSLPHDMEFSRADKANLSRGRIAILLTQQIQH